MADSRLSQVRAIRYWAIKAGLAPVPTASSVPSCTPTPLPTFIFTLTIDTSFSFLFSFLPSFLPLPLSPSLLPFLPSPPPPILRGTPKFWLPEMSRFQLYPLLLNMQQQLGLPLNENKEGPSLSYVGYLATVDIGFSGCKHFYGFSGRPPLFQLLTIWRTGGSSMVTSHGNGPELGMQGLEIPRWHPPTLWPWASKCPSCSDPSCLRERNVHMVQQTLTEGYCHPHPVWTGHGLLESHDSVEPA